MKQGSLFSGAKLNDSSRSITIYPSYMAWKSTARILIKEKTSPDKVWWQSDHEVRAPKVDENDHSISIPTDFIQSARAASYHINSDRWSMLYSILWRINQDEPHLIELSGDPHVVKLNKYSKAVRRDAHKMKAFVRFRAVKDNSNKNDEPRYIAWFEPDHNIVEYVANFFKKRFSNIRWSILTPERCAHWEGCGEVWFTAGVSKDIAPVSDNYEDAWRIYYRSIFNPARVKIKAMMSEMPQKYWKNLPEATVINDLLLNADKRVADMETQPDKTDELQCGPRPDHPDKLLAQQLQNSEPNSISTLALSAKSCRNCPLWEAATQTVFGEGPANARLMIVGEQPGDYEDLQGRPFVGPAGEILNHALDEIKLDRASIYITNTVKHFKYMPHGGQRVHRNPYPEEINSCLFWLEEEIKLVNPEVIVCLGKTAAQAQLGRNINVAQDRGKLIESNNKKLLITYHPAFLLRSNKSNAKDLYFKNFVNDLDIAKKYLN